MAVDENIVEIANILTDVLGARPRLTPDGYNWCYTWSNVFNSLFDVKVTSLRGKIDIAVSVCGDSNPTKKDVESFFERVVWPLRDRIIEFRFKSYPIPLVSSVQQIKQYLARILNEG